MRKIHLLFFSALLFLSACAGPYEGPDKQFAGELQGAVTGAGAGAVTGFQVASAAGPGAAIGAGFGAVAGGIKGYWRDQTEENLLALSNATQQERQRAIVHEILADHYQRRMELHPTRDIFPADIFFYGDEFKLRKCAEPIVRELARMNRTRFPWSRLAITAYVKSKDNDSVYAQHLGQDRARAFSNVLVQGGIDPRRLEARGVVTTQPLLIDPHDDPLRYNQAIEIIPLDK